MAGFNNKQSVYVTIRKKEEAKDQAEGIQDKKRGKDISPLYSIEWIKKTSFLLAIES
ncbi:MAG TPA: hypothetical protein VKB06_02260 [Nitrososphaera sp.]|nr:hypothetical protein [Nitrososphaera sp.]